MGRMRRWLLSILPLLLLIALWIQVEHEYLAHDLDESCEICLISGGHAHVAVPALASWLALAPHTPDERTHLPLRSRQHVSFRAIRAPPRFL